MIDESEQNPGAWRVIAKTSGDVLMKPLDDLVRDVGMIHLDVEGHELEVLKRSSRRIVRL